MKHKKSLFLLFLANGISGFAQGISMLAIPWFFASRGESDYFNTSYGLLTLAVLLFGLYAGTLVDRYSRKNNFMFTSITCGLVLGAIAFLGYANNKLPDVLIIVVFGMTMLNYNIHYPTLYAFIQEISEKEHYRKINSYIEIVGQSTSILSGAFAALLIEGVSKVKGRVFGYNMELPFAIERWEIWEIFMLDAFTYFIAGLLIYFIKYEANPRLAHEVGTVPERVKTGFSYLKKHPEFMLFGLFSYSVFATLLVEIHAVLPGYVERHLLEDGSVFAAADLIYAIGALSAGLFVVKAFRSSNVVKVVIGLTLLTAGVYFWAFATRSVWVIYIVSVLLGFANAGIRVLRLSYLFNHIPNELMGRVGSIFNMANVLTRSLFIFLFSSPFFVYGNQIIWAYFCMALFLLLSALVLIFNFKRINQ